MTDIKLKTVKGFEWRGAYAPPRSDIEASELDARELLRNGLIEDYTVKAAAPVENKKGSGARKQIGSETQHQEKG